MVREKADLTMRRVGWLSRQPRAFQDQVLALSELRHFPQGATIYNIGDIALDIWGLVEGELSVFLAPEASAPFLVHVAKPGWWMGDTALISGTPRRAELMAREESWLLRLSKQSIDQLAKTDSETWRRLALISIGHLDHALSIIAGLTDRDSRARVAIALRRLASLSDKNSSSRATIHVSHAELGEMVHLTRNALAPILKEFESLGLIRHRYRIIEIPDISALDRYAVSRTQPLELLDRARRASRALAN
jgi:CRP-like cAMP-binding protein